MEQETVANPVNGGESRSDVAEPKGWYRKDGGLRGSAEPIPGRCGRHLRGTDPPRYCKCMPAKGRDCCRRCGGSTPSGVSHYNYKNGKTSKYLKDLPDVFRTGYKAALADPELSAVRDELGLLTVRVSELLRRMAVTPPPWAQALLLFEQAQAASPEDRSAALAELGSLLRRGADSYRMAERAWAELREVVQEKGRLATIENKRLEEAAGKVTVEQALLFARSLLEAAREVIPDKQLLAKLQQRTLVLLPKEAEVVG
jgi:hypothetical protein